MKKPLENFAWQPSADTVAQARVTVFMTWLAQQRNLKFSTYDELWRWSVSDLEGFWSALADWQDIPSTPRGTALTDYKMPGAAWFPDVHLNYVDQVFRHATNAREAIVGVNESGVRQAISWPELQHQTANLAATLKAMGVGPGDRVAAFMPNIPETVIAFLAVASLGAVWSVCSPDMGKQAVLDRFRQISPKVMIAVESYRYGGKTFDRVPLLKEIITELTSLKSVVTITSSSPVAMLANAVPWFAAVAGAHSLTPHRVPFAHPLWIVYSSGTTGLPKPIVHSQGGVLLEHVKLLSIHLDLGVNDRFHWFTSTGWMMWNVQVAGLLVGSTICLYDGSPNYPDMGALWRFANDEQLSYFGAGAAYFSACEKALVKPKEIANLGKLKGIGSTGSPLSPESYQWILRDVGNLWISPISGGTDMVSAFVGGVPTLPVRLGEMQCRCLGAKIEAFNEAGQPIIDEVGEMTCSAPMPSMPIYFWNDEGNRRYLESYFETFAGIWRHGDWVKITNSGGVIIYGRSDTTINRMGIRMGTSELYRVVEELPEIIDSLVVDLEYLGRDSYMPLFVVLNPGEKLTTELADKIKGRIKTALSSRHVPNDVIQVPSVPRTLTGKKLELPIKKLLLGQPIETAVNLGTMANPDSLTWFREFAKSRN